MALLVATWLLAVCLAAPGPAAGGEAARSVGYRTLALSAKDHAGRAVTTRVAVWYPSSDAAEAAEYRYGDNAIKTRLALGGRAAQGAFPLVVYSHGATGCGLSGAFVTEELARRGFVVAAPDYPDRHYSCRVEGPATPAGQRPGQLLRWIKDIRERQLNAAAAEYRPKLAYRPSLLRKTVDALLEEGRRDGGPLEGRIKAGRVGLIGHSFGAWTSLLAAGADPRWRDARVGAVVALSGPVNRPVYRVASEDDLAGLAVPVLFAYGGDEKKAGRQSDKELLFDRAPAPKLLARIDGADHFSFSAGIRREFASLGEYLTEDPRRAEIAELSALFLRAFLAGDAGAREALPRRPSVIARDLGE